MQCNLNVLRRLISIIASLIPTITFALPQANHQIDFNHAVQLTLNSNPVISANKANTQARKASVKKSTGQALPNLNVEMNATRTNNPANVFSYKLMQGKASFSDFGFAQYTGPESINIKPDALNSPGYYNNVNTAIVLNIPVFSGLQSYERIKQAKLLLKSSKAQSQAARAKLLYTLLQSYEGVHLFNQIISNTKKSCRAASHYLHLTNELKKHALVIKGDVILSQYNLRAQKIALKIARSNRANALTTFRTIIGKPDSQLTPGKSISLTLDDKNNISLEQKALLNNPTLRSLLFILKANKAGIRQAQAENLPKINLQLRHDWNASQFSLSKPSNTALLQLNWQLLSSGTQLAADDKAVAHYKAAVAEQDIAFNQIHLAILKNIRALHTARLQLKESINNIAELKVVVSSYQKRYGKGLLTLGQLLDVQNRLDSARNQKYIFQYQIILAKARLLILINAFNFHPTKGIDA